jgi:hypothetical protein
LAIRHGRADIAGPVSRVRIALKIVQLLRLFRIARLITSNGLCILCYHGFALADEYRYRGTLFIKDELFSRCMKYLKRNNYPIYSIYVDALSEHGWVGLALFLTILGYSWYNCSWLVVTRGTSRISPGQTFLAGWASGPHRLRHRSRFWVTGLSRRVLVHDIYLRRCAPLGCSEGRSQTGCIHGRSAAAPAWRSATDRLSRIGKTH